MMFMEGFRVIFKNSSSVNRQSGDAAQERAQKYLTACIQNRPDLSGAEVAEPLPIFRA